MFGLPLAFAAPWLLSALVLLPVIWWLLRLTPPRPQSEVFPPLAILARLIGQRETPAQSPWWLTLLRLVLVALVILAMAGPIWNPEEKRLTGDGPVLLIVDNGWAAGSNWEEYRRSALSLVAEAAEAERTIILLETARPRAESLDAVNPDIAIARLESMENLPLHPDHQRVADAVAQIVAAHAPGSAFFLSDGLTREGTNSLAQAIGSLTGQIGLQLPSGENIQAIERVSNDPDAMTGNVLRPAGMTDGIANITAYDLQGLPVAQSRVVLDSAAERSEFRFEEPVELRNEIVRVSIDNINSAGAVQLLDDSYRRRLVGLVSGTAADLSQPLLSPLYYIGNALEPFSDIRRADNSNISAAVPDLIGQNVSAIVMADIGNFADETAQRLAGWVENGGMLIRFAGPRLAAAQGDELLPVRLRRGNRNLGGALSWETPKAVAPFEQGSPFYGLEAPQEVVVERQVLALQEIDLENRIWATLEDGTPLVTAARQGAGWIVLFHVSSDASWSNLPISGTFVEMLRRVVNQSRATGANAAANENISLPPLEVLNGRGALVPPGPRSQPLVLRDGQIPAVSQENPPGFYGTEDGFTALNLFSGGETLELIDRDLFQSAEIRTGYGSAAAFALKSWLLAAAAILLALDCAALLWLSGALGSFRRGYAASGLVALWIAVSFLDPGEAIAQTNEGDIDFSATLQTRLAYVATGDEEVDRISQAGLEGLTRYIATRTALEPGEPIGLDISVDELAFYPLIYWPVSVDGEIPDAATMARVDAFMKQGGSILFDTRDQMSGLLGGTANSPEARRLQVILSGLDIPPLEPVPPDHVLTKAFYLLDSFPGRYSGGDLWVEALDQETVNIDRPARAGDGVSSILITSNDMAAAWALDRESRPMFATVPPDPLQREFSFRSGVNLIMYAMTGNYKADQVHIPALLERLGQ
jgi:hypothetical protein